MKNLIYYPALLCLFSTMASCNKNDALSPVARVSKPDTATVKQLGKTICDSSQMVPFNLANSTGINSFMIQFTGSNNYLFSFPSKGNKTVYVKPGEYRISIPPTGDYANHAFTLDGQGFPAGPGMGTAPVAVIPCAVSSGAEIY